MPEAPLTATTVDADRLIADRDRGLTYGDLIREAAPLPPLPPRPSVWDPDPVRPHPRPNPMEPPGSEVLVVDGQLTDRDGRIPDRVRAYRARLETTAERWSEAHGYQIHTASWAQLPPVSMTVTVPFRLECWLRRRTDGQWPELWAAMDEDREDMQAALGAATATVGSDPTDGPFVRHITVPAPPEPPTAPPSPPPVDLSGRPFVGE